MGSANWDVEFSAADDFGNLLESIKVACVFGLLFEAILFPVASVFVAPVGLKSLAGKGTEEFASEDCVLAVEDVKSGFESLDSDGSKVLGGGFKLDSSDDATGGSDSPLAGESA